MTAKTPNPLFNEDEEWQLRRALRAKLPCSLCGAKAKFKGAFAHSFTKDMEKYNVFIYALCPACLADPTSDERVQDKIVQHESAKLN